MSAPAPIISTPALAAPDRGRAASTLSPGTRSPACSQSPHFKPPTATSPQPPAGFFEHASGFLAHQLQSNEGRTKVRDPPAVASKIAKLLAEGPEAVHVISDFDMTMTKYWVNGQRGPSSHHVLMNSSVVSDTLRDKSNALFKHYYPIEIDPDMPREEKHPHMEQWWRKAHDAVVEEGICEPDLAKMVADHPVHWRAGLAELIKLTGEHDIYFLVFSAGIKNLIKQILSASSLLLPHVHVESNEMIFSPDPPHKVSHFREPVIHVFNKSEWVIASCAEPGSPERRHAEAIKTRNNVILLGDSLGDAGMANGVRHATCLRIGWLNVGEDRWLDEYMDGFDVVILGDGPMSFPIALVEEMGKIAKNGGKLPQGV